MATKIIPAYQVGWVYHTTACYARRGNSVSSIDILTIENIYCLLALCYSRPFYHLVDITVMKGMTWRTAMNWSAKATNVTKDSYLSYNSNLATLNVARNART